MHIVYIICITIVGESLASQSQGSVLCYEQAILLIFSLIYLRN